MTLCIFLASGKDFQEIKVKCVNHQLGCDWTGELRALEEHMKDCCMYNMTPCTNKCLGSDGEEYMCMRKDLEKHLKECQKRRYKCCHCEEEGAFDERTTTHLQNCPEVPTTCPNEGCNEEIPAKRIKLHLSEDCPFTVKTCKYESIGCTAKVPRKDLDTHQNDDKLHMLITMKTVAKQREEQRKQEENLAAARTEIQSLRMQMRTQHDSCRKLYKLTEYQKRKAANEEVDFPPFYTSSNGYHMFFRVYPNGIGPGKGTHISVNVRIIRGDCDSELKWPFTGTITIELLNQIEDRDHFIEQMILDANGNAHVGDDWGLLTYVLQSELSYDSSIETQYLKDDSMYFRVSVGEPEDIYKRPWLLM